MRASPGKNTSSIPFRFNGKNEPDVNDGADGTANDMNVIDVNSGPEGVRFDNTHNFPTENVTEHGTTMEEMIPMVGELPNPYRDRYEVAKIGGVTLFDQLLIKHGLTEEEEEAEEAAGNPVTIEEVAEFLRTNPNPEDYELHQWAEARGVSPHAAEELIYQLAAQQVTGKPPEDVVEGGDQEKAGALAKWAKGVIPGGLAAGKPDSKYNKHQLQMGIEVEKEHTPDSQKSKEIAKDHLEEHPRYYTALDEMEKRLEEKKAVQLPRIFRAVKPLAKPRAVKKTLSIGSTLMGPKAPEEDKKKSAPFIRTKLSFFEDLLRKHGQGDEMGGGLVNEIQMMKARQSEESHEQDMRHKEELHQLKVEQQVQQMEERQQAVQNKQMQDQLATQQPTMEPMPAPEPPDPEQAQAAIQGADAQRKNRPTQIGPLDAEKIADAVLRLADTSSTYDPEKTERGIGKVVNAPLNWIAGKGNPETETAELRDALVQRLVETAGEDPANYMVRDEDRGIFGITTGPAEQDSTWLGRKIYGKGHHYHVPKGMQAIYSDPGRDPSVIAHEVGHSLPGTNVGGKAVRALGGGTGRFVGGKVGPVLAFAGHHAGSFPVKVTGLGITAGTGLATLLEEIRASRRGRQLLRETGYDIPGKETARITAAGGTYALSLAQAVAQMMNEIQKQKELDAVMSQYG